MTTAEQALDLLSVDLQAQRLAAERADAITIHKILLLYSEAQGMRLVLLKLIGVRFGSPADATRARFASATIGELDTWAERILTAQTIDEVFAP
jgi:hypothetical protein